MKSIFSLICMLCCFILHAQVDSLAAEEEYEDSIVYIVKEPHYIRKTIHLRPEPLKSIALEIRGGPSFYHSYYDVCPECKVIFDSVQSSVSTKKGLRIGAGIIHSGKRFTQQLYIDHQEYEEKFSFDSIITSTNRLEYLNVGFEYGIKFIRLKRFQSIFTGAMEWQRFLKASGSTFSEDYLFRIVKVSDSRNYRDNILTLGTGIRNYVEVGKRTGLSLSFLYRFETVANTALTEPFIEQKSTFHGLMGVFVYLN